MTKRIKFTGFISIVFIFLLILPSCSKIDADDNETVTYQRIIPDSKREKAAEWVRSVVEAAYKYGHNGGDLDDPEDVVAEARRTARDIFGELTIGISIHRSWVGYIEFIPYEKCSPRQKALCDKFKDTGGIE